MFRSLSLFAAVTAVVAGVAACDETPIGLPQEAAIVVPFDSLTLIVGEEAAVSAHVVDDEGKTIPDVSADWTSTTPGVATVAANGIVDGVSLGTANLIASYGNLQDTVFVTVVPDDRDEVRALEFEVAAAEYTAGQGAVTVQIEATDAFGNDVSCFEAFNQHDWEVTSSDEAVVTADFTTNCVELDILAAGEATVTLTLDGISATHQVTVN